MCMCAGHLNSCHVFKVSWPPNSLCCKPTRHQWKKNRQTSIQIDFLFFKTEHLSCISSIGQSYILKVKRWAMIGQCRPNFLTFGYVTLCVWELFGMTNSLCCKLTCHQSKKNRQPKPQILLYKKSSPHYFIWRTLFNATAKDKRFP